MPLSPSSLDGYEFNSHAEEKVYQSAYDSGYFDNNERYLFHSLNMAHTGNRKLKAEIDFVYFDRDCMLFLEVKGGQVKFDSLRNDWYVLGGTRRETHLSKHILRFFTREMPCYLIFFKIGLSQNG
jgi:hypothetical protein